VQCWAHRHRNIRISDPSVFETFSNRGKFARYSRGFRGKFTGYLPDIGGYLREIRGFSREIRGLFAGYWRVFAGNSRVFAGSAVRKPRPASAPLRGVFAGNSRVICRILAGFCGKFAGYSPDIGGFSREIGGFSRGLLFENPAPRPRRFAGFSRAAKVRNTGRHTVAVVLQESYKTALQAHINKGDILTGFACMHRVAESNSYTSGA
jgi:hypothetical protein